MAKKEHTNLAVREAAKSAGLVARQWQKVEEAASEALANGNGSAASLRLVASAGNVSGVIDAPGMHIVLENGAFAIELHDAANDPAREA